MNSEILSQIYIKTSRFVSKIYDKYIFFKENRNLELILSNLIILIKIILKLFVKELLIKLLFYIIIRG